MSLQQNINKYWNYLEQKYPTPRYVAKVKYLEFKDLKEAIDNKNEDYIKKIIKNMYVKKEAYILKNSATKKLKKTILDLANQFRNQIYIALDVLMGNIMIKGWTESSGYTVNDIINIVCIICNLNLPISSKVRTFIGRNI